MMEKSKGVKPFIKYRGKKYLLGFKIKMADMW